MLEFSFINELAGLGILLIILCLFKLTQLIYKEISNNIIRKVKMKFNVPYGDIDLHKLNKDFISHTYYIERIERRLDDIGLSVTTNEEQIRKLDFKVNQQGSDIRDLDKKVLQLENPEKRKKK